MICLNIVNISVNETFDAVEENIEPVNRNMDDRLGVREVNNSFVLLIISKEYDNASRKIWIMNGVIDNVVIILPYNALRGGKKCSINDRIKIITIDNENDGSISKSLSLIMDNINDDIDNGVILSISSLGLSPVSSKTLSGRKS